ncbi:hypothetical protein [Protofrankia symbiont of Coriaria ruscifolia]|uniref:hypothetical protein n=1 Tax=Protofrankia symbiont of Coriaria ruscifolia TaxID=1306542 RepID=UPI001A942FBC|nr:hypothetical protein [Protofrankia symbiont of Coriaria ruscifolia]
MPDGQAPSSPRCHARTRLIVSIVRVPAACGRTALSPAPSTSDLDTGLSKIRYSSRRLIASCA